MVFRIYIDPDSDAATVLFVTDPDPLMQSVRDPSYKFWSRCGSSWNFFWIRILTSPLIFLNKYLKYSYSIMLLLFASGAFYPNKYICMISNVYRTLYAHGLEKSPPGLQKHSHGCRKHPLGLYIWIRIKKIFMDSHRVVDQWHFDTGTDPGTSV